MRINDGISRIIGSGILLLLLAAHLTTQSQKHFEWRDASGNVRSLSDLEEILRKHRQWIESGKKAGTRANLDHANLAGANLTGAKLDHASLTGANLTGANLDHAILTGANLTGANLDHANLAAILTNPNLTDAKLAAILTNAKLTDAKLDFASLIRAIVAGANLTNAKLTGANLTGANLNHADLSGAILDAANLDHANLTDAFLFKPNLTGANLDHANLEHAVLFEPNLTDANLDHANLTGADLDHANLTDAHLGHANLTGANLTDAKLVGANLSHGSLSEANLTDAHLGHANLTGAILIDATLTHAFLADTTLVGAKLFGAVLTDARVGAANFDRTVFEPNSLPPLEEISRAKNLELLTYYFNPAALVQLRKQFEDGGLREQERKITYALKRREAELSWARGTSRRLPGEQGTRAILWSSDSILANLGSFTLNKVFFDWTCQYGMSPGRPLILGVVLWFLCSLLYFVCIHTPGEAGLYRVYGQSIRDDPSAQRRVERISPLSTTYSPGPRWLFQFFRRECLLLRASMFFSLMSAFNIGFRDINFGRWLRLLTRQEFDIKAVGWARVIAGWQSLISVYLIALWVLTFFGRPFD